MSSPRKEWGRAGILIAGASAAALTLVGFEPTASAQIKSPGSHPHYSVEVEPHLVLQWGGGPWGGADEGIGVGGRFSIPIVEDGPIKKINNSMAIGFGLDWAHFSDNCWGWGWHGNWNGPGNNDDCSADDIWFPVVLQWNFWLTKVISVFGEPGLALVRHSWEYWYPNNNCPDGWCKYDDDDWDVKPLIMFGGARFMFGDTAGLTVRLGWPYASVGASLLF